VANTRLLLDTSVLIRFFSEDAPLAPLVKDCIEKLLLEGSTLSFTPQVVRESWGVLTRPKDVGGYGLSTSEANSFVVGTHNAFDFLADVPDVYLQWLNLVRTHSVSGKQVHDAYHVAAMKAHNLDGIITLDARDFKRYAGIQILDPRSS
jgi:predicted nucleic acid-binding protein